MITAVLGILIAVSTAACGNNTSESQSASTAAASETGASTAETKPSFGDSTADTASSVEDTDSTAINCEGDGWSIQTDGDQLILAVSANSSTGYSWVVDDAGSDMFTVTGHKYADDDHPEEAVGYGGTEYFYITVKASGTGGLTFEYKQDWDGGESDGKYDLNVTAMDKNGGIVITDADFTPLS